MTYLYNLNYDKLLSLIREVQRNTIYFKKIHETNDNIMVSCPYHKGGQENKPSCGIDVHTLVYHCFSCGAAGSFVDMMFDIYKPIELTDLKTTREEDDWVLESREKKKIQIPTVHLDYNVGLTKYLQKRQLTQEVCQEYLVGYKDDEVVFPVRNHQGNIIFYVTRNVYKKEYKLSKDEKPLYGVYELLQREKHPNYCFIVESPINALTLRVWGYNAIALMGTGSKNQMDEILQLPIREFILCFDGDSAGREATKKFYKSLVTRIITPVYMYEGKDINDLNKEEFIKLLKEYNINEEELK